MVVFFCKQKTAYEMRISDWSSDVCSSDLAAVKRRSHYGSLDDATANARLRYHRRHDDTLHLGTASLRSGCNSSIAGFNPCGNRPGEACFSGFNGGLHIIIRYAAVLSACFARTGINESNPAPLNASVTPVGWRLSIFVSLFHVLCVP